MAWIEVHQSLLNHRKTQRLARLLEMDQFAVVGRLIALWSWALDNAPDGAIAQDDLECLPDVLRTSLGCPELVSALVRAGFLEAPNDSESVGAYLLHDWHDYAGKLFDRRRADAERKRRERAERKSETSAGRPQDVVRTSAATVPYRTVPYRSTSVKETVDTKTTKEVRREARPSAQLVKNGPREDVRDALLAQIDPAIKTRFSWRQLLTEYQRAADWVKDHPASQMDAGFLERWYSRIKPEQVIPEHETDVQRLQRLLKKKPDEKGLIDGQT